MPRLTQPAPEHAPNAARSSCRFVRSLRIGRAPDNDLVLPVRTVSSVHACIQLRDGGWAVKDLGSANGTTVDGQRIEGWHLLSAGAELGFGPDSRWVFEGAAEPSRAAAPSPWWIEELAGGARHPLAQDRMTFGRRAGWDRSVEEGPPGLHAVLFVEEQRIFLLGVPGAEVSCAGAPLPDDGPAELSAGQEFSVQGRGYRLVLRDGTSSGLAATAQAGVPERSYPGLQLRLVHRGDVGDIVVRDERGEHRFVDQELRFALLRVLAEELLAQAEGGGEELGWLDDESLRARIWGRRAIGNQANSTLAKLMHDTRAMFGRQGIDGLFVEKRRGRSRLRLPPAAVELA